jgi:ankyrin repeat protein
LLDTPHGTTRATALHVCAVSGDADALELLLDANADAHYRDANERTALWHAAARGHAAAVDLIAKRVSSNNQQDKKSSSASNMNNIDTLNAADAHGATALHAAARVGARGAIAALLNAGADATRRDQVSSALDQHHSITASLIGTTDAAARREDVRARRGRQAAGRDVSRH